MGIFKSSKSNWPPSLYRNKALFNPNQKAFLTELVNADQGHLFETWEDTGTNDDKKVAMVDHLYQLHSSYPVQGGLFSYLKRARELLADSKNGVNPFQGWIPEVPLGATLDPTSSDYYELEKLGMDVLETVGFVLVAGGLGERLGYNGIKLELPVETTTNMCYLEWYCRQILAMQKRFCTQDAILPLAIMVSDDTASKTEALLKANDNFGMAEGQITLMKQEKVAALSDNDARIAMDGPYHIEAKPHGHGDVHALMHSTGTAEQWAQNGTKYVVFFQDTNGLAFRTLPAMIGVSRRLNLEVNSLAVPRVAKQAVGAICRLRNTETKAEMTINVEYNQLDPLLRATGSSEGDVNDPATGLSPFPGNINQLVFALGPYLDNLSRTKGLMSEFVNPKYKDAAKTVFKKPTRLECMMQDYPKALSSEAKVGFTTAPAWLCYSPCKNNVVDAAKMAATGVPGGSGASAEADQYFCLAELMRILGCDVEQAANCDFQGVIISPGPRIVFDPSFAIFPGDIREALLSPEDIKISSKSTLRVSGHCMLKQLDLRGSLSLEAQNGSILVSEGTPIENAGQELGPISADLDITSRRGEVLAMRGYSIVPIEEKIVRAVDGEQVVLGCLSIEGKIEEKNETESKNEKGDTTGGNLSNQI
jgi:UDP-sugar pyrophosphorylase